MSYSINVIFKLRNISVEQASELIKRLKEVSNKNIFREKFQYLDLSNIKDNDERILNFVGETLFLTIEDMSQKKLCELLDSMGELSKKVYFFGGDDLKWSEKFNQYVAQGVLKKEIFTKGNIEKYVDYFNKNQESLTIEKLKLEELIELVRKFKKLNNKFILNRGYKEVTIISEKDINYCAKKFIDTVSSGYLSFDDYLIHLITKRKGYEGYKWIKPGEIYFGVSIGEHYFKYFENDSAYPFEEMKKNTAEFLKVLKIIYETLKPEYGWGGNELDVQGRMFDLKDYWWFITIYGPEIVDKIGREKIETLPIRKKIRCSDGGYILLLDYYLEYTLESIEKAKKHLFGK